ncbi:pyrimidine utilization protein A [Allosediminivita pacifica]|uniref:Pyrimidine monooxygenase RutA n=1 Tax=Allosediminivita pacifica TaxID=1267769 RepID=A0A2T6ATS9_9RHOB|nr:pyrimidine utilization protein A [Allosediminivita pacifica]PTX47222.1 pyrimidine oxygenase [Allosediminivita pacifica]GGB09311.1 pyrimidine monooxygenase RutA [Allosediminivita pacifica]
MDIGVFIPINNNGWLISKTSPQYMPSFELNLDIVQRAESYGLDFALSMIKLRGFGGESEFWDHGLESFTLMSALAARTERIRLFASSAILTLPPALTARMISTIDSVAPGRIGVNIVTGWAPAEYTQMGIWPGNEYFGYRYDYATEYVRVMKELWETGKSDFDGEHFHMEDCKLSPQPQGRIEIVAAGQSDTGMAFSSQYSDYSFVNGIGVNTPAAFAPTCERLMAAAEKTGRDVGAYILMMCISDETDEAAMAKWEKYRDGADVDALAYMGVQGAQDAQAAEGSTAKHINLPEGAVNFNMGTIVGSYESCAKMLDEAAAVPGVKGIMLTFDDFGKGLDDFGTKIQPLMKTRDHVALAAE